MLKDPPRFVTNAGAWEYVLARMATKQEEDGKRRLDADGNPLNYAAAVAYYKNAAKKYPAFQATNRHVEPFKIEGATGQKSHSIVELMNLYPAGQMFWYDDVLCEAVEFADTGEAVYSDPHGALFIRGKILDVDPGGANKDWPVGKTTGFPPHRCAELMEGAG